MKLVRVLFVGLLSLVMMGGVSAGGSELKNYWAFNESSSPSIDYVNSFDATWYGTISPESGITKSEGDWSPGSVDIEGNTDTNQDNLQTNSDPSDYNNNYLISLWVYREGSGGNNPRVLSAGNSGQPGGFGVLEDNGYLNGDNSMSFRWADSSGTTYEIDASSSIPSNDWTHYVGLVEAGTVYFYEDGNLVGSSSNSPGGSNNNEWIFGDTVDTGGSGGMTSDEWNGNIDEARFYRITDTSSFDRGTAVSNLFTCNSITCNQKPIFDSVSTSPSPLLIGETADFSYNASDPDGSIQSVDLTLKDDGNTVFTGSKSTATGTFNPSYSLTEGDITAKFTATDNAGATATTTISESLQDTKPEFSIEKPVNNKLQGSTDIQVEVKNTEDDDKPGENPTVNLKIDGTTKQSFTVQDTEDFTKTVTGKEGSQTLTVEMVENDGDTTTKTRTVEIDTTPPNVDIETPGQNQRFNSTTGIPLEFTRSDANLDTSTCKYSKDIGTNISLSSCLNTTIQYSDIGTHNVTVYVSDSLGNTGKDSSTFQVDILNSLTVQNQETNTALSNYTATITNGTKTIGGFQTEKVFQFFTGDLPKGDINATVTKDGFQGETQKFTGVDNTFNQDISFELERSGLNIKILDEQTNSKLLGPKKIEISNSTDTLEYFYGNQYIGQDFGPEVADNDLSTKTGFGESDNNDDKKRTARVSVSLGQSSNEEIKIKHSFQDVNVGCRRGVHTHLNKVQAETTTGSFNTVFSSGPGSGNQGVKTTTVTIDNSNGKYTGLLKVQGLIDGDDSCFTNDFNLFEVYANNLTNLDRNFPNYPTGNVEIQVDDNFRDKYRSRTVETTLDSTTKLNLDAYLLEKGQGIFTTVEVLENEQDQLKNAEVRIRRNFDGEFKTVATDRTATDGTAGFFLDPDTQYQASISKTGFQTFQGTFSPVNYQADPFKVALGKEGDFLRSNVYDSVKFKIQPRTQSVNKTVTEFNFTVSDLEAQISDLGINLSNGDTKAISGTPSGGTVLLESNLTESNLSDLELTAFFVKDGERYNIERTYNLRDPINPGIASITNVAGKLSGLGNTTRSLLAVLLSGFVAFSLKSRINRKGGSLVTLSSLGIFVLIGWLPAFYWLLTLLTVIGLLAMR